MKLFKQLLIVIFLLTTLSGCAALTNKESETPALQAQSILKFPDLPVPAGFKILAKDSYSFESSGMRVGLLRYQGKGTLDQVVNFYKEQMPMYNWALLNITEYGDCIMNFDRDIESCIISINVKGGSCVINLAFGPKSQISPKKSKQKTLDK
ncbi:MAG: hypothetical protein NTW18_05350 [Candidatus Omnitrophica bacterium]|nr:hypothetical protein [Candidatus Omnitrophota bacterium]